LKVLQEIEEKCSEKKFKRKFLVLLMKSVPGESGLSKSGIIFVGDGARLTGDETRAESGGESTSTSTSSSLDVILKNCSKNRDRA
jgi:hypothetical protein